MTRHLPNFLTLCNLLTGMLAIVELFQGDFQKVIFYILVAGIFDFLDGFAARMLKVKSELGGQLDSLADMISFSAVPSLYLFRYIQDVNGPYLAYFALLIAAFSALRLAKFNIDDTQTDSFMGLPTPANAVMITSLTFLPISDLWMLGSIIAASCLLLVAPLKMLALKFSTFHLKGNEFRYVLIAGSVVLIALMGIEGLVLIIPFYIILSILANFVR
ncbi:MAG: CDP-diacylglycerol--serine O-phosphatidyltransferase [Bacteroidota bacterium]